MCDHCERIYSEVEYDDLQSVCNCGHLITSHSHLLFVRRRLTRKQSIPDQDALGFSFNTRGKRPETAQVGEHATHDSGLALTSKSALVVDGAGCSRRYSRKSKPVCESPKSSLFSASLAGGGISMHLPVEETWKPMRSSPKKRSIKQIDEIGKEFHVKKPRCSLPRSWQVGGA